MFEDIQKGISRMADLTCLLFLSVIRAVLSGTGGASKFKQAYVCLYHVNLRTETAGMAVKLKLKSSVLFLVY